MKKWYAILINVCILSANPIATQIINEFQVAPYDSERVEFRYFQIPSTDTIFDEIPLFNTLIITPAGSSVVDTAIYLPGMGYSVIDESVLTGNFWLPNDSGYIKVYNDTQWIPIWDSIYYPGNASAFPVHSPAPPNYCSAAKFHCAVYDSSWPYAPYGLITDWYIDSTPTFGNPNDDYPGCEVSGHVYDNYGSPLSNARVTATLRYQWLQYFNPPEFYQCCTTYTLIDGSYTIDSLLPSKYKVDVWVDGYSPDTQTTPYLYCLEPVTDLDFYMQIPGISEYRYKHKKSQILAYPNPFYNELSIVLSEPHPFIDIYDVAGELCIEVDNQNLSNLIHVDCSCLPKGVYFISISDARIKVVKF